MLKGPTGTEVNVEVKRDDLKELLSFKIERGKIPIKALDVALMINDTIGYVKISKFGKTTYSEFVDATNELKKLGLKNLILDLRDNTGGHLDQAFMISNEFLNKNDLIVYFEGKNTPREDFFADGSGKMKDIGLTILINENSASASEIVAGAIQDNDRGTIVGRRSYGKGLVQRPIYFSDNSGIRLTIARYYTPTGRCVQKPYNNYEFELIERFRHGEFMVADSIKTNDSLKYITPKGKIVYGGGGIIPDIFVPMDTVGVTNFLINVNRRSLIIKYSNLLADRYRKELRKIKTIEDLNSLYSRIDVENSFLNYAKRNGVSPVGNEWEQSKFIIIQQLKALMGRYSVLDDKAFYTYFLEIDNVIDTVKVNFGINKGINHE
jgi:Periplasmic protease